MLRNSGDHTSAHERLKVRLKGIGFVFGVQFPSPYVKRKRIEMLLLLGGILNGRLRPLVERILFRTVPFRLNNVLSEGIELAFHAGAMLLQDFRKLLERAANAARHARDIKTMEAAVSAVRIAGRP